MQWLGIWMLLATTDGWERRAFWEIPKADDDTRYDGAPFCLNDIMSRRRFEEILGIHCTYNKEYPAYTDRFHPIRDFVKAWNDNMKTNFSPSWIVCLDESMSLWTNMFTCPGFVFCPRKPWIKAMNIIQSHVENQVFYSLQR